ncbi:flagellar biosynthesis protein FlhF [Clostridioides sp. ZZV15-6388]|nr:flagellar biosynthesis protein FlhF [Clostridioides sp. ZZV15-6388]MCC0663333.1 flagellar biosynthesis protein FlhF [Clostridioides sp. ZZV15-6597]
MMTKKYTADTIQDAMNLAKMELGDNITLIDKKEVRKSGIRGIFSKRDIELTVGWEKRDNVEQNDLKREVEQLKSIISNMGFDNKNDNDIDKICKNLLNLELNEEIVESIRTDLQEMKFNGIDTSKNLVESLKKKIKIENPTINGKIALVGPPGVGKTTTIAKLAAKLVFEENKKVGVITIDTYRIGAVEQLKIYTDIMNIPFKGVISPDEMELALDEMKDCDVVLIDTTGRGYKNSMQILEIKNLIDKAETDNIHLVLNCTTRENDTKAIIDSYKNVNFKSLIITKLDETITYGSIFNIVNYAQKPISYITIGQNVPDDIIKPNEDKIIRLLLGVESI